jgi:hypothetical protein
MRKINNKKAAFEMTMGTIVIIVLAVSMLVLGLVLTKKIMCSGMVMTDKIDQAVSSQISGLFGGQDFGIKCMGDSETPITFGGGGGRQLICVINTLEGGPYTITYKSSESGVLTGTGNGAIVDLSNVGITVLDSGWSGTVSPGKKTVPVVILKIPQKVPLSNLKLVIQVRGPEYPGAGESFALYPTASPSTTIGSAIC